MLPIRQHGWSTPFATLSRIIATAVAINRKVRLCTIIHGGFRNFYSPYRARGYMAWQEFPKWIGGPDGPVIAPSQPGMPVRTGRDEAAWREWRGDRILTAQRDH